MDSWGNIACWTIGTAVWWVLGNGKEKKRKREPIKADSTTEDEDEEKDVKEEEGDKVKGEPISPPPLRRRRTKE